MNYWVISDTHLGHNKMVEQWDRPVGLLNMFGNNIVLTHAPVDVHSHKYVNVHGHLHSPARATSRTLTDRNILFDIEGNLAPVKLCRLMNKC
jgi:calcineurin-like phosphoesterase family protein